MRLHADDETRAPLVAPLSSEPGLQDHERHKGRERRPAEVYLTFEQTLEVIERFHNMTCGMPQVVYLTGWQFNGHDLKYPSWAEGNPALKRECDEDPVDSLRRLIREARKRFDCRVATRSARWSPPSTSPKISAHPCPTASSYSPCPSGSACSCRPLRSLLRVRAGRLPSVGSATTATCSASSPARMGGFKRSLPCRSRPHRRHPRHDRRNPDARPKRRVRPRTTPLKTGAASPGGTEHLASAPALPYHPAHERDAFTPDGAFLPLPDELPGTPFLKLWEAKLFTLLLDEGRIIRLRRIDQMRTWKHSGISVDSRPKGDRLPSEAATERSRVAT